MAIKIQPYEYLEKIPKLQVTSLTSYLQFTLPLDIFALLTMKNENRDIELMVDQKFTWSTTDFDCLLTK